MADMPLMIAEELKGKKVFVRTMGAHFIGILEDFDIWTIKLSKCCWLADPDTSGDQTKRQQQYWLVHGLNPEVADVQPYPNPNFLNRGPIEGITEYDHDLFWAEPGYSVG